MLEQIQQMITTATETLRQDFRQQMGGMAASLRGEMGSMEFRLGERLDRHERRHHA
jgi:hypothetical protein